ncbi:MFS transporter [Ruminococcus sp.]|uniref:MFS transporter n=1 Tax=Ruminococcus sp. TaxID=41978 RepID=UPI00260C57C3|nr:MFS transporter [Ruminococcus sp.]MEE0022617.1 MFS transporter [Ruminococcus sp.]
MYLLLLAVIYIAFISLGLPDSLLGAAWPTIRVDFDVPLSYMGLVSMIIAGGTIISGLLSERLTKKFGTRTVTIVSVFLTAAALLGFSTTHAFYQLCLWGIPYGLGAGAIDAALNNYVALHYNSRHMSWLHCFWGVGTIISPYIMSYALTHSTWNHGYRMVSYLQFAIVVILLLSIPLWNIHKQSHQEQQKTPVLGIKGALKIKGVPTLLIGFFAYCAAEATTMLWASSYLEGTRGISKDKAAAFGSLFFIGITVGRFLSGFISEKFGDNRMIRLGTGIALCGVCCIVIPNPIVSMIGFIIIGLGCAPVYPCIIHSTPYNFGAENSQGIIGIQMASAYVGSTFMPPIFGLIANHISLQLMPIYLAAFLTLLLVMISLTEKKCHHN